MTQVVDGYGRQFPYLRLSITEVCNFRCTYCLPDGYRAEGRPHFLERDEIARLVAAFAEVGMWKVRITGGEPSVRKDLPEILETVAATPGVRRVAMTTNGYRLPRYLPVWRRAGLNAFNVSIDSLNRETFREVTGHDRLPEILEGIDQAIGMDFDAVKVNTVLLRGVNDDQLDDFLEYVRERPISLRFIELMQTGDNLEFFLKHHLRGRHWIEAIERRGWQPVPHQSGAGPAQEFTHPEYRGRIGFITPYSKDFCVGCNRLRVTARGDLRLCLFGNLGIPLRHLLQSDDQRRELQNRLTGQLRYKHSSHYLHSGDTGITPHLASTGG